jgi:hypothetical protein
MSSDGGIAKDFSPPNSVLTNPNSPRSKDDPEDHDEGPQTLHIHMEVESAPNHLPPSKYRVETRHAVEEIDTLRNSVQLEDNQGAAFLCSHDSLAQALSMALHLSRRFIFFGISVSFKDTLLLV